MNAHIIIGTCFTAQDISTNITSIFRLPNKRLKITKALSNELYRFYWRGFRGSHSNITILVFRDSPLVGMYT